MSAPPVSDELTPADVEVYTSGRLPAADPETQRMLDAALAAARREAGWHVCPVITESLVLDGFGGRALLLPTMNIVAVANIVNNGNPVDPTIVTTAGRVGWLLFISQGCWSYRYAGVTLDLTHGFTAEQAPDWREAILLMVSQMSSMSIIGRPDSDLSSKQVDDVVYKWGAAQALPGAQPILEKYQLPTRGFA
jgi:hypothetical protein